MLLTVCDQLCLELADVGVYLFVEFTTAVVYFSLERIHQTLVLARTSPAADSVRATSKSNKCSMCSK